MFMFFLFMDIKVVVGFIYDVIECIDMDGIVAFFTFMYKLLSLDEVLAMLTSKP